MVGHPVCPWPFPEGKAERLRTHPRKSTHFCQVLPDLKGRVGNRSLCRVGPKETKLLPGNARKWTSFGVWLSLLKAEFENAKSGGQSLAFLWVQDSVLVGLRFQDCSKEHLD